MSFACLEGRGPLRRGLRCGIAGLVAALAVAVPFAAAERKGQEVAGASGVDGQGLLAIDLSFYDTAAATGGDFYFWAPGEFSRAPLDLPTEPEPVLLAYGTLGEETRSFEIPVDDRTGTMSVFAGGQRKDRFVLFRPGGEPASDADADVRVQEREHQTIVTLTSPEVGRWRLEVAGRGRFGVSARVSPGPAGASPDGEREEISLLGFEFVELRGRPGHEGLFPVREPVRAGEERTCRIVLSGPWQTAEAAFVTADARTLVSFEAARDGNELLGPCSVPLEPFRLRVSGRSRGGAEYQRFDGPLRFPGSPIP